MTKVKADYVRAETCPECGERYDHDAKHFCNDGDDAERTDQICQPEPIRCAFCEKEMDSVDWVIAFGNVSLLGKVAVNQVCPDCILEGFGELEEWRMNAGLSLQEKDGRFVPVIPHPFDCKGCPDCQGVKNAGPPT